MFFLPVRILDHTFMGVFRNSTLSGRMSLQAGDGRWLRYQFDQGYNCQQRIRTRSV